MRVLLVEEDRVLRALLWDLVAQAGHQPTSCGDAAAAWAAFAADPFPLVITESFLPAEDGLALCRQIRAHAGGENTVIVLFTGHTAPAELQRLLNAGADDYLAKPLLDPDLLSIRLQIATREVRLREERRRAETSLNETVAELARTRDDMHSILDHVHLGSAVADPSGAVSFLSATAQAIFELSIQDALGHPWQDAFPFKPDDIEQLARQALGRPEERAKLQLHLRTPGGRYYWLDTEVKDDPVDPRRKIFLFYDMSEMYGLRRLLDEKAQFHDLVGKSKPMRQVYQSIQEIAGVDLTVLIEGETGTGKELVARAIHSSSHRSEGPFIAVNCAGLTDSLLASQLFGHKRGAFTGAIEDHQGVFEAANGGTLFLDEIGEIPMNVQTSLLRVLQEKEITRVGESRPRKVDVRVITATNRSLAAEVDKGVFRADLYYRIRVARIALPALRTRREDIPLLTGAFLTRIRAATGRPVRDLSDAAMHRLLEHDWPGNVRELENVIEFAAIRGKGSTIDLGDLPPELTEQPRATPPDRGSERQRLVTALEQAKGNRVRAARLLGISRATLYRRLERLGLSHL